MILKNGSYYISNFHWQGEKEVNNLAINPIFNILLFF